MLAAVEHPVRRAGVKRARGWLVVEVDRLGQVLGPVAVGGDGHRHRLAREADHARRQRRPGARRQPAAREGDRFQLQRAGVEGALGELNRREGRGGGGSPDEGGLEDARQLEVGEVGGAPEHLHRRSPASTDAASRMAATIGP